ncbi:acyltransferase [Sphingobacterium phlebotomi]|uniref:Acyltransferase n=1 Tax=Sphingobacterium phlebotomi TaxID=2605433 RepID=A0A5D4H836_9SPHI|nr:acyltransferase [Sphingobacterium phlebotomi]TYR36848.1 acyltransferase [Sphingobacterium phlebotomi]
MRELNIETLRGIAIILMVLGHVVGVNPNTGLKVDSDSWYHYLFYIFKYIRMPLFTVISGYVYAIKPISKTYSSSVFIIRKINRLLIPYIIAATLFFILQVLTPGTNSNLHWSDLPNIFITGYAHFWFVQGIFFVFILILLLERLNLLSSFSTWSFVFATVTIIFLFLNPKTEFLSINSWPFLLLFFLWGLGLKRFESFKGCHKVLSLFMTIVFCLSFLFQQYIYFSQNQHVFVEFRKLDLLLTLLVGLSSSFLLVNMSFQNSRLIKIGNYSYEIYLYHVFATAGCRIILHKIGVTDNFPNLILGLFFGVAAPIFIRWLVDHTKWGGVILFGDKVKVSKSGNWMF